MLYIHIPYCRKKCVYCDFFSGGARIADWERFGRAIVQELRERIDELPELVESVYFGGGTPSLMPPQLFTKMMEGITLELAASGRQLAEDCEITIEVNPEDVDEERISAWLKSGVNRVSLGIQTFSDALLRSIGRSHSGDKAAEALEQLKGAFGNLSGDLIFGIPGQTVGQLEADVKRLISLEPQHVSVYSMMYEEGTALTALRDAGRVAEVEEDVVNRQYRSLTALLSDGGFDHYEISNYAKPGRRSRHNSGYWSGKPYLGLGPSAHSYDGARLRRANPADLKGYLARFSGTEGSDAPFYMSEQLTTQELMEERIMLSLRTREGLDLRRYERDFEADALQRLLDSAEAALKHGHLQEREGHLVLSAEGIMVADTVIVDLI